MQGSFGAEGSIVKPERPWAVIAFCAALALLYAPVVAASALSWFNDDDMAHGVFIIPVSLWILWMQRDQIRELPIRATAWGLAPLALGLLMEIAGYAMGSKSLAMLSLIPALSGAVLMLHGRELLKASAFPIGFLFFTARLPFGLSETLSQWIQRLSSAGSAGLMNLLGYAIIQRGNQIQIPGFVLDVADVCSGFKKLLALVAFALLYGYLFQLSPIRRALLVAAAIPIAVIANIVRISGLIAVTSAFGLHGLHLAHDGAEIVVLVISFFCFVAVGKLLGCERIRFSP